MKNWMIAIVFALCLAATPAMAHDCTQGQCRPTPVRNAVAAMTCKVKAKVCCIKARRAACCGIGQKAFARLRARRCCR